MIRNKLLVSLLCMILALLLAGCGNNAGNVVSNAASKTGDAVSKAGEGISRAESRMESDINGTSKNPGVTSSHPDRDNFSSRYDDDLSSRYDDNDSRLENSSDWNGSSANNNSSSGLS